MINPSTLPVSDLVLQQVPSFVRENHDKFVEFLTNYYEYLDQNQNINDYIRNVVSYMDVDQTTEALLSNFFEELRDIPHSIVVDKRLLVKHIHDLYDTKGTANSFELLFRILFDEQITIEYPSDNILRASAGTWKQEVFITVQKIDGTLPTNGTVVYIEFQNQNGKFRLKPTKIVVDERNLDDTPKTYRVFFNANDRLLIGADQVFYTYSTTGIRTFVGRLTKSPSKLVILDGGKYWQRGALFVIPGSRQDTICRVTGTTGDGVITQLEVIQYGMGHADNQSITVSPFPNKPVSSIVSIEKTLVSYNPTVYNTTMTINDYTDGTQESISGNGIHATSSFGGVDVFSDEDVTIEQWIESRATVVYTQDVLTRAKGEYTSEKGKLSNPLIRLQDNRYYQLYSYVIKTEHSLDEYQHALSLVHPSGMKFFAELQKSFSYSTDQDVSASRTMSVDRIILNDSYETFDAVIKDIIKPISDDQESDEQIHKHSTKPVTDNYSTTMNDTDSRQYIEYMESDYISTDDYTQDETRITIN